MLALMWVSYIYLCVWSLCCQTVIKKKIKWHFFSTAVLPPSSHLWYYSCNSLRHTCCVFVATNMQAVIFHVNTVDDAGFINSVQECVGCPILYIYLFKNAM